MITSAPFKTARATYARIREVRRGVSRQGSGRGTVRSVTWVTGSPDSVSARGPHTARRLTGAFDSREAWARHDQRRTGAQQQAWLARDEQAAHVRRGAFDAPAGIDVVPAEMLRTPDDAARGRLACLGVGGLTATLRQQVQHGPVAPLLIQVVERVRRD